MEKNLVKKLMEVGAYDENEKELFNELNKMGFYFKEDMNYFTNEYYNIRFDDESSTIYINYVNGIEITTDSDYFIEDMKDVLEDDDDIIMLKQNKAKIKSLNPTTFEIKVFGTVLECTSEYNWNAYRLISGEEFIKDLKVFDKNNVDIRRDFK